MFHSLPRDSRVAVIGASGGIGQALVSRLEQAESVVEIFAFSRSRLDGRAPKTKWGYLDVRDEASIRAGAAAIVRRTLDLVIVASGALSVAERMEPEKRFEDLDPASLLELFAVNVIGPALVAKHFLPLLSPRRRGVLAALSARVGSISDNRVGGWYGYRSSKAALNMIIRTLGIEMARRNRHAIVVGLHPGTVDTPLSRPFQRYVPAGTLFSPGEAAEHLLQVIDHLTGDDSGQVLAWDGQTVPA